VDVDVKDLARGLVAGLLMETVEARGRLAARVATAVAVLAVIGAVVADGGLRILLVALAALALVVAAVTVLLRRLVVAAIRRIGQPRRLDAHRAAIDRAIDQAELPTGPWTALKAAWRLRKGVGPEVDRLHGIVDRLTNELRTELDSEV
jgi:hypothetical protein